MSYLLWASMGLAVMVCLAVGIWQLYAIFAIVFPDWGVVGLVVAYLFFPFTLMVIPVYSGFVLGEWAYLLFYPAALLTYALGEVSWWQLKRSDYA